MRVPCVGAVVLDEGGRRLLVVRRAHPPAAGRWSLPGGRVEAGESLSDALVREVREETGLHVRVGDVVGHVEIPFGEDSVFEVTDFRAAPMEPCRHPVAGDDASAVEWVSRAELATRDCSPGLMETLDSWAVWSADTEASAANRQVS